MNAEPGVVREVRVLRIEIPGHESVGRGYGIDLASGELVAFIAPRAMLADAGMDVFRAQSQDRPELLPVFEVPAAQVLAVEPADP